MSSRKRTRVLTYNPSFNSVWRGCGSDRDHIRVSVEDLSDETRPTVLDLDDDEALRLATRLAGQLGYKLVEAS